MLTFLLLAHVCAGHPWLRQHIEEFISAYGPRKAVHNGRGVMATGGQSRKQGDHIFQCKHKERMNWNWGETIDCQSLPLAEVLSPAGLYFLEVAEPPQTMPLAGF